MRGKAPWEECQQYLAERDGSIPSEEVCGVRGQGQVLHQQLRVTKWSGARQTCEWRDVWTDVRKGPGWG